MKQTTLPVSPAFIVKAHKAACNAWKNKLEGMYPSVLTPTVSKISIGQKVRIATAHDSHVEFMIAQIDTNKICLISMKNGNRWRDAYRLPSTDGPSNIPVKSLMAAAGVRKASDLSINRVPLAPSGKPSNEKTLTANIADIKSAYEAAGDASTKKMIKDYFPTAFGPELFDMYKDGECTITDINANNVFCGLSAGPRELYGKCLMINQDYGAKPEITEHTNTAGTFWVVTFPKKA